ncbi:MAG TPA: response regulator [Phycisphaerae bacterium]|nr:response regulator [Phycisphaerae bacterium]HRW55919.1 response regulator [Phycisphaerae bacterium]
MMTWIPDTSLKILLIDDDDVDGELLRIYLQKISHLIEFRHCTREQEALDVVTDNAFDLIFVDNRLSLWTGSEMLAALRDQGYNGPAVLYTGHMEEVSANRLRSLKCLDFLEKGDVNVNTLRSTIESAMGRADTN